MLIFEPNEKLIALLRYYWPKKHERREICVVKALVEKLQMNSRVVVRFRNDQSYYLSWKNDNEVGFEGEV